MYSEDWALFERPSVYRKAMVVMAQRVISGELTPKDCGFGEIEVDRITSGKKERIICRVSSREKYLERIINYFIKIEQARINLLYLDGGLTNFLPGTSPMIQSGPRFRPFLTGGQSILVANLDVKRCFDSLRWRSPAFVEVLAESRAFLVSAGCKAGADYQWRAFHDYFLRSLKDDLYKFYTRTDSW